MKARRVELKKKTGRKGRESPNLPVITLLTDFGTVDYFVGAVKGAIGGLSTKTRGLIVLAVVLGLLLGPVALVLLLVGLLVFAIVAAVRSRGPT